MKKRMKQDKQLDAKRGAEKRRQRNLGRLSEEEYIALWHGSPPKEEDKPKETKPLK